MALQTKVGTFAKPTTTGTQAVTGVGFEPKAIFFWSTGAAANAAFSDDVFATTGMAAVPLPTFNMRAFSQASWTDHAAAGSVLASRESRSGSFPIIFCGATGVVDRASDVTFDADGFTLNWTLTSARQVQVHYLAIGGDGIYAGMRPVNFEGLAGEEQAVEGFGFRPQFYVVLHGAGGGPGISSFYIAALAGSQNRHQYVGSAFAGGGSQEPPDNRHTADRFIRGALESAETTTGFATFYSTPDGFRVKYDGDRPPGATPYVMLGVGGDVLARYLRVARSTTSGAHSQVVSAIGFRPKATLLINPNANYTMTDGSFFAFADHGRLSLGAADDAGSQAAASFSDQDDVLNASAGSYSANNRVVVRHDNNTRTITAQASIGSFTNQGFTLSWLSNDTTASTLELLAIGELEHSLEAETSSIADARAEISTAAVLTGSSLGKSETVAWLGPAHLVTGESAAASAADAVLPLAHSLSGTTDSTSATDGFLALDHPLTAADIAATSAIDGFLGTPHALTAETLAESAADGTRLTIGHVLTANIEAASTADGYLTFFFERPRLPLDTEMPGTVNLVRNPSAEQGLSDWEASGDATIARVTDVLAWHGIASVHVDLPSTSPDEGVIVQSLRGLALATKEHILWGHVRMMGDGVTGLSLFLRGHYSDGTTADGDAVTVDLTSNWLPSTAPALLTNPTKILIAADLHVVRSVAAGVAEFWIDGAQVEEDQGSGPTPFAYGGFGAPHHFWLGTTDLSPSFRDVIAMELGNIGDGGVITIKAQLFKATHDNQHLRDLSEYVIDGKVTMDPSRDVTWTLSCKLTSAGWKKLRPYRDWLAPVLTVTYPDGTVKRGQLGLYLVWDSPEAHEEWDYTVEVRAYDMLWFLNQQAFTGPVVAHAGRQKDRAIREILDSAVLTEGERGTRRYQIPDVAEQFKNKQEWERKTKKLELCNLIAQKAGLYNLWTTSRGIITTRRRGKDRLRHRAPVRVWAANVPDQRPRFARSGRTTTGEVVGVVNTTPKAESLENEILLVSEDPKGRTIKVRHRIRGKFGHTGPNFSNPRSVLGDGFQPGEPTAGFSLGRAMIRTVPWPVIDDDATAREVAASLADELSTRNTTVRLTVLPDPSVEYAREVIGLAIWNLRGDPVAVGLYAVHSVEFGFTPATCLMTIDCGRVTNADDLFVGEAA